MTHKHTPGPWKDYGHAGQINGADNSYICQVESKNTKADIALIAAAPELLGALQKLVAEPFDRKPQAQRIIEWGEAQAAIAKATGEA